MAVSELHFQTTSFHLIVHCYYRIGVRVNELAENKIKRKLFQSILDYYSTVDQCAFRARAGKGGQGRFRHFGYYIIFNIRIPLTP